MNNSEFAISPETQETEMQETNVQEIAKLIEEFEKYRERLLNETLETAKKAKLMKSAVMAQLEPELAKIDATIATLRDQQGTLNS
ncbi:hypothetical protein NIES4101_37070 [Calothrix sp. NIES-4101]|nr:hypothetical protein NIES4101_37070 [Calothrix sp. NIES-4101]